MTKHILLLYIARTGSSHIWQLFKNFREVQVYGEILNGPEKYLKPLKASEKLGIPDEKEEYKKFAKGDLEKYIKFLCSESDKPYIFTKISLVHVYAMLMNFSPTLKSIFKDPNTEIIILQRNLLDSFISLRKVGITKAWRDKNTSDIKIKIDKKDFTDYCKRMIKLYQNLFKLLEEEGCNYQIIKYEILHKVGLTNLDKIKHLKDCIKSSNINLSIDEERLNGAKIMLKQDQNTHHKDKIQQFKDFKYYMNNEFPRTINQLINPNTNIYDNNTSIKDYVWIDELCDTE